jgi:cholesterol transport system auxiliary component
LRRLAPALIAASALLAGCVAVSVGSADAPGLTYFVLADARPATVTAPSPGATARLAIQANGSDPLADSTSIVFSRRTGERALYQLAVWTERPSRRLAQLAQQRLEARGKFAAVTQLGQPIATDWLLTLAIETLVHDVSTEPGRAQLVLRAELIRRSDRSRVAQRVFSAAAPVAEAAAASAVTAFGTATADVLDQLADWVEATAAAHPVR